jgi:hypothetical protein
MAVEKASAGVERVFSKRTMQDQFGNYPEWMGKRKMRTQQRRVFAPRGAPWAPSSSLRAYPAGLCSATRPLDADER